MANVLLDGSVLPSYMASEDMGHSVGSVAFSNIALRQGEVREIIYPDSLKSVGKRVVEYSVAIQYQTHNGPPVTVLYPNCVVANLFGGVADKFRYTLRAADETPDQGKTVSNGSKVLVACVNGESRRAYILAGLNDDPTPEKSDDGHNISFEFNGLQSTINKSGEFQITYQGATQADGSLSESANSDASGSFIQLDKDGGILLGTGDQKQEIHLDRSGGIISSLAKNEWKVTSEGSCSIKANKRVFINSAGVYVGAANEAWILGTTYRNNEHAMNQTLSSTFSTLASLISTASSNLQLAATFQKVPVSGAVAATVPLQAAALALSSAGTLFTKLSSAIAQFETDSYLSTKNFGD